MTIREKYTSTVWGSEIDPFCTYKKGSISLPHTVNNNKFKIFILRYFLIPTSETVLLRHSFLMILLFITPVCLSL